MREFTWLILGRINPFTLCLLSPEKYVSLFPRCSPIEVFFFFFSNRGLIWKTTSKLFTKYIKTTILLKSKKDHKNHSSYSIKVHYQSYQWIYWVAISFSRGSSWPKDQTLVSHTAGSRFTFWATRETQWMYWKCLI